MTQDDLLLDDFCSPKKLTDVSGAMYYNNLACLHMMMDKHSLGAFYFKKALNENETLAKELKLETLGMSDFNLS